MAWYRAGTVSCAQNSSTVTGTNTAFADNCRVGDAFLGPDGAWYEVTNVPSQTALAITPAYRGATVSGGSFALVPVQGYNKASADALRSATQAFVSSIDGIDDSLEAAQASAAAARTSEANSHTSEANAAGSASAAAGSASAAAGSATSAGNSATAAGTSATNAKTSETNAKTSETNAASSAGAAAQSAQQAADKLSRSGGKLTGALDWANFVALASADTVDIGGAASNLVQLTGTTTINTFKAANAGAERRVLFTGAMTLVHSAKIVLPGAVPIVTSVGDWADFICWDGTNWYCTQYQRNLNPPALLTQSATDTTPGRLLKVGDFGLGSYGPVEATNLNNLAGTGFYITSAGTLNVAFGVGTADGQGYCFHQQHSNPAYATQQWTQLTTGWIYVRMKVGGTWSAWSKQYGQNTLLGTVTQSSGVPTGAVIEGGSNANGKYVRWADGTQICYMHTNTATIASVPAGAYADIPITLPAAFLDINWQVDAMGIPQSSWDYYGFLGDYSRTATSTVLRFRNGATAQAFAAKWKAIGRWF